MEPLTLKQFHTLEFLKAYRKKNGIGPSYKEIGKKFGLTSKSSVAWRVGQLEKKGYILRRPFTYRWFKLLKPGKPLATNVKDALTPQEKKVLAFIKRYMREHFVAPTVGEISKHLGPGFSDNSVTRFTDNLHTKGWILKKPMARYIKLL